VGRLGIQALHSGGALECCSSFDFRFLHMPPYGFSHNADN